jgi:hypothetical protein
LAWYGVAIITGGIVAAKDGVPFLEVKRARIARAGLQAYTADEIARRGLKPTVKKDVYLEYRPAEVVLRSLSKFNMVPFVNDHTSVDVTPDNWKDYAIGVVGSSAAVEVVDDQIFVTNDVVFYDQKAYDDYKNGKVELSAGYDTKSVAVDNPDAVGYDFVLVDIPAINHVALCDRARAGRNARVLDSLNIDKLIWGSKAMSKKSSPLRFFGFGKTKDSAIVLSKIVFDSLAKFEKLDVEAKQKEIVGVIDHVAPLGDSDDKEYLVAAITDSFQHVEEALAKKDEVGKIIDGLYAKCQDADEKAAKAVVDVILGTNTDADKEAKEKAEKEAKEAKDAKEKEDKEKADKEAAEKAGKDPKAADTAKLVEDTISKALAGVADSISASVKSELPALIEKTVKETLGVKDGGGGSTTDSSATDDFDSELDPSFLLDGVFETR